MGTSEREASLRVFAGDLWYIRLWNIRTVYPKLNKDKNITKKYNISQSRNEFLNWNENIIKDKIYYQISLLSFLLWKHH